MKVFVSGIAGFLGSHLAERLVKQGHIVSGIDNFSSGKWENISGIPHGVSPKLIYDCDCRHYSKLNYIISEVKPDYIYHLASTVGVQKVINNPRECIDNCLESLRRVLELGIPGMFTSTSEVYGKTDEKLREDSPLIYSTKSRWSYAMAKMLGEHMVNCTPGWKSVRLFNVVGPRQSMAYGAVLPRFVKQALNDEPITIYGSGHQVRTFIDVRDCVEILDNLRDIRFDVVNVGGYNVTTIEHLASKVWDILRFNDGCSPVGYIPYESAYHGQFDECMSRIPDLSKLDRLLPVRSDRKFSETVRDIASYIESQKEMQLTQKE